VKGSGHVRVALTAVVKEVTATVYSAGAGPGSNRLRLVRRQLGGTRLELRPGWAFAAFWSDRPSSTTDDSGSLEGDSVPSGLRGKGPPPASS
jgi:hypothetical protein